MFDVFFLELLYDIFQRCGQPEKSWQRLVLWNNFFLSVWDYQLITFNGIYLIQDTGIQNLSYWSHQCSSFNCRFSMQLRVSGFWTRHMLMLWEYRVAALPRHKIRMSCYSHVQTNPTPPLRRQILASNLSLHPPYIYRKPTPLGRGWRLTCTVNPPHYSLLGWVYCTALSSLTPSYCGGGSCIPGLKWSNNYQYLRLARQL